jgi:small basic protein (TIGR04137 family)
MSVHKSLVSKMGMSRSRNVYRRDERLAILKKEGRITGDLQVLGLPKTKVVKTMKKAAKAEKKADEKGAVSAPAAAAPAAAATAAGAKGAAPAAAAKAGDKKAAPAKK